MSELGRVVRILTTLVALCAVSACTATYRNHGYAPSEQDLADIKVGTDTRQSVGSLVGQPTTSGLLTNSGWYYVKSQFRHFAYQAPEETEREVVSITFDDEGVVQNIERFGLEDGRVVVLSRRVTDSNIQGVSFLRQLFGNLGRIDLGQIL